MYVCTYAYAYGQFYVLSEGDKFENDRVVSSRPSVGSTSHIWKYRFGRNLVLQAEDTVNCVEAVRVRFI